MAAGSPQRGTGSVTPLGLVFEPAYGSHSHVTNLPSVRCVTSDNSSNLGQVSPTTEQRPFPWADTYDDRYPLNPELYPTEFDRKYPRDRFGQETDENARVWRIYQERAGERDEDLIEGWKETLDVLLVFAGLFSAVCTGFILESHRRLEPDWEEITARSAYAQWASTHGGPPLRTNPTSPDHFVATRDVTATNWLWFLSLSLSLLVSLLAILSKQWISQYRSRMRAHVASHKRWVWRHHASSRGLSHWKLDMIISTLPILLHIALFLFLVGLVTFILPLNPYLSYFLAAMCLFGFTGYIVVTLILPLIYGDCPMSTPLLDAFIFAYHSAKQRFVWWIELYKWHKSMSTRGLLQKRPELVPPRPMHPGFIDPADLQDERLLHNSSPAQRDVESLLWMIQHLPTDEEVDTALDAIGTLSVTEHRPYFSENVCQDLQRRVAFRASSLVASLNPTFDEAAHVSVIRTRLFLGELEEGTDTFPYARLSQKCAGLERYDAFFLCQALQRPAPTVDVNLTVDCLDKWFLQRPAMDDSSLPIMQTSLALWMHASAGTVLENDQLKFRQLAVLFHCLAGQLGDVNPPTSERGNQNVGNEGQCRKQRPERMILDLVVKRLRSFFSSIEGLEAVFRERYNRGNDVLTSALTLWGVVLQFADELEIIDGTYTVLDLYSTLLVQSARRMAGQKDFSDARRAMIVKSLVYVSTPAFMRHSWSIEAVSALYDILQALLGVGGGHWHMYLSWSADIARLAFSILCQHHLGHGSAARDLEQRRDSLIHRLWNIPRDEISVLFRDGGPLDIAPEHGILNMLHHRTLIQWGIPMVNVSHSDGSDGLAQEVRQASIWGILCAGSTSADQRLLRIATDLVMQLHPLCRRGHEAEAVKTLIQELLNDTVLQLLALHPSARVAIELRNSVKCLSQSMSDTITRRVALIRATIPRSDARLTLSIPSVHWTPRRPSRSVASSPVTAFYATSSGGGAEALQVTSQSPSTSVRPASRSPVRIASTPSRRMIQFVDIPESTSGVMSAATLP
ncbi:hypothetical protein BKA62DRAFT_701726 [Auriculariales sp. MPI-PUGE-AT-0066]|nr:hypothetical protein BKA62DRAFT_701726 [Auriculariales sp. MPI-PUGE-AT-0066]